MTTVDFPVVLRPLVIQDVEAVKALSDIVFPINYPLGYFCECITQGEHDHLSIFGPIGLNGFVFIIKNYHSPLYGLRYTPEDAEVAKLSNYKCAYISTIAIQPSHQRRGLASFMMAQIMYQMSKSEKPPDVLYLHVMTTNEKAIRFYRKMGFEKFKKVKNFYKSCSIYPDAYIMIKKLDFNKPQSVSSAEK
ncbi:unnamed protein product [Bursaphelenchus okinawaensis]|uniref:N-alpha-acetyltransferase 60 n=1 Tax=Bursaphelenchus okinawaensis TaxID=465554 RepID=A0A811LN11_9BILA|nr:unnamed protein product [Bursaphelenchus okinawaensis]CAG9125846.1 unnamed protein product [Bursaphelenchus okinawaensis]